MSADIPLQIGFKANPDRWDVETIITIDAIRLSVYLESFEVGSLLVTWKTFFDDHWTVKLYLVVF